MFLIITAVTKELTSGLEMAANIDGKSNDTSKDCSNPSINLNSVILRCTKLYPELFNPSGENAR